MPCPNLTSWNAILSVYNQNADHREAIKLFRKMQFQCQHPDPTTLGLILSSCMNWDFLRLEKWFMPEVDIVCWNSMLAGFSINALQQDALSFFKQMSRLDFLPSDIGGADAVL